MRFTLARPFAIAFLPLFFAFASGSGCKQRTFNAKVKNETAEKADEALSALSPASTAKALSREECVSFLREKTKAPGNTGGAGFDPQRDTAQFLYCRDVLTASLQDRNDLQCITTKTNFYLYSAQHLNLRATNSEGYHLKDADYELLNRERISLGSNLPSFLDLTQADEQKRKEAQSLLARLFTGSEIEAAYAEVLQLVAKNNSDLNQPHVKVTRYQVERTLGAKGWRLIFLKEDSNTKCTHLTSFVPAEHSTISSMTARDISSHTICEPSSMDRVDKKSVNGVWMFNWKPDVSSTSGLAFTVQKAGDGHCYRCHQSKSKLIYPDVAADFVFDETSKATMEYIQSGENHFRKKADWMTAIAVDGVKHHVAHVTPAEGFMPTSFSILDADGSVLREQPKNSEFESCIALTVLNPEKAAKDRASCRTCHSDDPKSIVGSWVTGGTAVSGSGGLWPLVLQTTHPFHKFHKNFSNELFQCLNDEDRSMQRKAEWVKRVDYACAKLAGNPEFDWLAALPMKMK